MCANTLKQILSTEEHDGLPFRKPGCIRSEPGHRHDLHLIGLMMCKQAIHFADDIHGYTFAAPVFALHQDASPLSAQDQVDASIRPAKSSLFDDVALAAECFTHKLFEFAPAK